MVALVGARQVGKTTLARKLADRVQGTISLDLERVGDRRKLEDAEAFLQAQVGHLTVLDEVQRLPALFAELRGSLTIGHSRDCFRLIRSRPPRQKARGLFCSQAVSLFFCGTFY
ncbi:MULTISPECIES: AAA family ATPase [unclassified Rhizobium]|uniref:AAA family ATPase n=1 Tax=unclassified Rhizobium TaxID=2613769 RepID=UPI0028B052ED|nr:AAA family ATPase [Rhizobium sp. BK377]